MSVYCLAVQPNLFEISIMFGISIMFEISIRTSIMFEISHKFQSVYTAHLSWPV